MAPSATELSSAIGHPLRRRILLACLGGEFVNVSVGELASALDERVAQVAYHLKALASAGLLRLLPEDDGETRYGWAPGIDPAWLRLVLALSVEQRR